MNTSTNYLSNLLFSSIRLNENSCKKVTKLNSSARKEKPTNCPGYRNYSPKVRQQIVSNKLLNSQLYELYTVRKLHIEGKKLKNMLLNGTIKVAGKTYVISWLDIIPMDAFNEPELVLSLRTPRYKDSKTHQYPLSYGVVSKFE